MGVGVSGCIGVCRRGVAGWVGVAPLASVPVPTDTKQFAGAMVANTAASHCPNPHIHHPNTNQA
jgi:hypothetical protein